MPADNTNAIRNLRERAKRGGHGPGRRPGLPEPKKPAAGTAGEQAGNPEGQDRVKPDAAVVPPAEPATPVDEEQARPPAPQDPPAVDEPPVEEKPSPQNTGGEAPENASPELTPPVKPSPPNTTKPARDQRKRTTKRPSAPLVLPEHRVNWNPEARQIRAELLGWCAARAKVDKRAADVARVVQKTYGDVPEDDLRAIVVEVAQRTGQPVKDIARVAGYDVD